MHLRQPGMNISNSKNQNHTLKSPIWSKPVVDCLLSNAGHCKIIKLMSHMLMRSSSHTLAVLFFQALCRISSCIPKWLSFCLCGFLQQVCFPVATGLCRKCRRFACGSPNLCASKTLALELCVERDIGTTTGSECLAWSVQLLQWVSLVALLLFSSPPAQSSKSGNLRLPTGRKEGGVIDGGVFSSRKVLGGCNSDWQVKT